MKMKSIIGISSANLMSHYGTSVSELLMMKSEFLTEAFNVPVSSSSAAGLPKHAD